MPNYDFMSPSAAVLHVQALEDEENRLADKEIERLKEKDRMEREKNKEKEREKDKEKEKQDMEKENKKEEKNNSTPPSSTSIEDFDTWKDCASNPKKQQKKLNDQKKVEKTDMFKSIQNVKKDAKEGPMAWFTRLPEMDEEMPSVSYLGGWIDRTRRYLSNSVVQLEKNEKKKRMKRREDVLNEKKLFKKAEKNKINEKVEGSRNENLKMETIDEGIVEKESQKDKEVKKSPTSDVLDKAKRCLSNVKNMEKEQVEDEEDVDGQILRKFSVEADNDRNSPKSIPELSLKTDSKIKFTDEKSENDDKILINGFERRILDTETNLIRMNSFEELNNNNNTNNDNINNNSNGENNGEKKEMRKLSSTKKRTVSFTLDSLRSELSIAGGENGKELEGYNGNMNGNGNVNVNSNYRILNALKDSVKNDVSQSQIITPPPPPPPPSENSPLHSYQPRIRKNQLNSPPPITPLATIIQQNNKYSPDKTSRDFFALSPSPPATLSHAKLSTASSASSSGLFPYFDKGISSSEESYESSVQCEDMYKDIENDKKKQILDNINNFYGNIDTNKNVNDFNIINGHNNSNNDNNRNNNNENIVHINNNNNNNNDGKESWVGNDEDTNKKYTEVGGICDQLDYILSIHNFENMDVSGSTFSPYRTQGNGKTWLEQIIKAADKPLRQTNTKKSSRTKRGFGTELNDLSDGQKSVTNSTSSLNSSNYPSSSKLDIPSSTSTPAPTPTSIALDDSSNTSIESNSQPFCLPLPTFTLPHCVYDYPLAPPLLPFINGMTETELHITQKLSLEIRKYNSTFLGRVSEPNAWKEYVKYNRATNDDEFYPNVRQLFLFSLLIFIY